MILNLNTRDVQTQIAFKQERIAYLNECIAEKKDQIYILEHELAVLKGEMNG